MIEISNIKVYDLKESVIASGNAMRLYPSECTDEEFQKGLKRMTKLVKATHTTGINCHDNALTGIRVSFDIKYPQYWTPEFQRYHFADIVTSSSKMHRLLKMNPYECCNKYTDRRAIAILQEKIDDYNSLLNKPDATELQKYVAFMEMVSNCPLGLELFMRVSTNYKQLQTIYKQRKDHKLKEDWGAFCKMIEELPYFKELILGENE